MKRKPCLAGNWKMYKTSEQAQEFFKQLIPLITPQNSCEREIIFGAPFTCL
ncbi:MAG: triose-phosphate isomerase, partial [Candidatus Adiutrix sp.]